MSEKLVAESVAPVEGVSAETLYYIESTYARLKDFVFEYEQSVRPCIEMVKANQKIAT
jgi:hypothetical protein